MPTRRPPSGDAGGALRGQFPKPAVGNPPVMGFSVHDEFIRLGSAGDYGDTRLTLTNIGATATITQTTPTTSLETGIMKISTGVMSANEGGGLGQPVAVWGAGPAVGAVYMVKLRSVDTADVFVWSGFAGSVATVNTADTTTFIGFRGLGGGDWEAVVKTTSGGGNEEVVSLGTLDATFQTFGFRYIAAVGRGSSAVAYGVQFFTVDADTDVGPYFTDVGDLITTNIPTGALLLVPLAIVTVDGSDKAAEIDYYTLGGKTRR